MRFAAVLLVAFACSGAFASEPGQPVNCSDWVQAKPGFTCVPADFGMYFWQNVDSHRIAMDNESGLVSVQTDGVASVTVLQYNQASGVTAEIGHLAFRGGDRLAFPFGSSGPFGPLLFDPKSGVLFIPLTSQDAGGNYSQNWVAAIRGFATDFDVLQTYTPQPAAIAFRVPYMPEGLPAADHFDTYWGPLAHPIDFTQAHPLQCGYPTSPPHVGDYITVADPLPNPEPGTGRYYVTAATYQGQTRYGRKTTAGHMSGRDPSVLPVCAQP